MTRALPKPAAAVLAILERRDVNAVYVDTVTGKAYAGMLTATKAPRVSAAGVAELITRGLAYQEQTPDSRTKRVLLTGEGLGEAKARAKP